MVHCVRVVLPKARKYERGTFDKALLKFYQKILDGIKSKIDLSVIRCVVLAGPGFLKSEVLGWLTADGGRNLGDWGKELCGSPSLKKDDHTTVLKKKSSLTCSNFQVLKEVFFEAPCSTANKQGLQELLSNPSVSSRIAQTRAAEQTFLFHELTRRLQKGGCERACYGGRAVQLAVEEGAVEKLLIADGTLRCRESGVRKTYVDMVKQVRAITGRKDSVVVFSAQTGVGEKLKGMGGVAGLLRFEVEGLFEVDSDEEVEVEGEEKEEVTEEVGGVVMLEKKEEEWDEYAAFRT